jgi:hypothetical protein
MKSLKKKLLSITMTTLIAALYGCASDLIDVRKGSDRVSLSDESQIGKCQSKGGITVSVLAEVGFISRSDDAVEANLLQMARNGAIDAGGDTITKGNSTEYGKRTFAIYKCQQ